MSLTAIVNAVMRAHHASHDAPKIFDDFLAEGLFAPDELAALQGHMVTVLALATFLRSFARYPTTVT